MLRPKKAKEVYPSVAKELNLSESLVEDVNNFYWREVSNSLTSASSIRVGITNFGTFNVKPKVLDREFDRIDSYIKNYEANSKLKGKQRSAVKIKAEDKRSDLQALKNILNEEKQRKEFIDEHKKNRNNSDTELITDMEK